jgi:hypothetical protein
MFRLAALLFHVGMARPEAIDDMVRARHARFSQKAGMRRDNLYKTFNGEGGPSIATAKPHPFLVELWLTAKK